MKDIFITSGIEPFWTKETTEELIDVASILGQVHSDGWVLLSITGQHHYKMWRDWE